MRVLRGRWAGRALVSPAGRVRPTSEELRDVWLTELEPELDGARILELYAGTGALGIEALSRGAASCDFVENNPAALHALKANVTALRLRGCSRIFKRDVFEFVERIGHDGYDIALADPPYQSRQLDYLIESWLTEPFSNLLSVEHAADHRLPTGGDAIRFGDSAVTFYRASPTRGER